MDHVDILQTTMDPAFSMKVRDDLFNVHGSIYLTVFGHPQSTVVPFGDRTVPVPHVGLCSAPKSADGPIYFLICDSALRYPAALVSYHFNQISKDTFNLGSLLMQSQSISYTPFPADIGISPVNQELRMSSSAVSGQQATVDTMEPLAHIRLSFEVNSLRLGYGHLPRPLNSH
jgi:hypothetical protein